MREECANISIELAGQIVYSFIHSANIHGIPSMCSIVVGAGDTSTCALPSRNSPSRKVGQKVSNKLIQKRVEKE